MVGATPGTNSKGISVEYSDGVKIDGVTVSNPVSFSILVGQSRNVNINNFKSFSSYGSADGIHMKSSENVTVDDCFVRANDDTISVYASQSMFIGSTRNVTVRNSTLITDAAHNILTGSHALEEGYETITDLVFENLDMVDSKSSISMYYGVMAINAGSDAFVRNVRFNNIRVEDIAHNSLFDVRVYRNPTYSKTPGRGIENVVFSNITYKGSTSFGGNGTLQRSIISGYDTDRKVNGVQFENVIVNGEKLTAQWPDLIIGQFAEGITFN